MDSIKNITLTRYNVKILQQNLETRSDFSFAMKFVIAFSLFMTLVRGQDLQPFDFNIKDTKSIWESPELQQAVEEIKSSLKIPEEENIEPVQSRIIGGYFALPGQFPHHVLLNLDSVYICGGSLLNANWVLTVRNFFFSKFRALYFYCFLYCKGSALCC